MIICGIDPGITGSIALLDHSTGLVVVQKTPTFEIKTKASGARKTKSGFRIKNEIDIQGVVALLKPVAGNAHVIIEDVHSMPKQGIVSCWTFAMATGIMHGIIAALGIPMTKVSPVTWKKFVMQGMGKEKDAARARASQIFPSMSSYFRLKCDDGNAEACLLAWYGSQLHAFGEIKATSKCQELILIDEDDD